MLPAIFAEVQRRTEINEGCRLERYFDSVGVPTIAYGFNLERGDAHEALSAVGVSDPQAVIDGRAGLTQAQADALLARDLPTYIGYARRSLAPGIFDSLTPARQCAIVDLAYNLGESGWGRWGFSEGFAGTRALINAGQTAKLAGKPNAHVYFEQAASHLERSTWHNQVGDRAKRDEAMILDGVLVDPNGDGSE